MAQSGWLAPLWDDRKTNGARPLSDLQERIAAVFADFDRTIRDERGDVLVRSNVSETDREFCITAELPGMDQHDIDVVVSPNQIAIKGEKKSEKEERKEEAGREFLRVERSSGRFERVLTVPFEVDSETVRAAFKDGVLTVTVPKPAEVAERSKKIDIEPVR